MHTPLAVALICWAASFYCGCMSLRHRSNSFALKGAAAKVPDGKPNPNAVVALAYIRKANAVYKQQFWSFISGAVLFLIWHILDMSNLPAKPFWT